DIAEGLATPATRTILLQVLGTDPLIRGALVTLLKKGALIKLTDMEKEALDLPGTKQAAPMPVLPPGIQNDTAIVRELIERTRRSVAACATEIQSKSGPALLDFIRKDIEVMKKLIADPQSTAVLMAGIHASAWINENIYDWTGEKGAADTLSQSVPYNITSEMGLALLDVADRIRPYPRVVDYLQKANSDNFLEGLSEWEGGAEAREALEDFLHQYGMRGAGEIDITRSRWSEKPLTLVPMLLNHIQYATPQASQLKFEKGKKEATLKEQELLCRLNQLPDGAEKARQTREMIRMVRNFMGYREYPKYGIVQRYYIYKHALLKEAGRLHQSGVIAETEDIFFLTFEELQEAVVNQNLDPRLIDTRKHEYASHEKLSPPRVYTSQGEIFNGQYPRENLPEHSLAGLAVSSGVVEGRARVILNMEDASLQEGDILVTRFTDPSWTPLFVSIKGLVTEVGGLMTHGAVIAREYGIPTVVGVEQATRLIKDGQRIRVHGTEGFVEIL
ncbi:MAG: phosphoenolpyruvate synthase, partial [Bacteroidota bacterium]|nr:phosphoenolpyruvate synthase [Bacteroidota bacterium]